MFKFSFVIIFSWLLYGLTVGDEAKTKEKVYYKHTPSTAAVEPEPISKDEVPIVIEGQRPSSESVKLNSEKINTVREIMNKESKTVPRKGVLNYNEKEDQNVNETLHSSAEKPVIEKNNTAVIVEPKKANVTSLLKVLSSTEKTSTLHVAPVREEEVTFATTAKTTRKPKPKPEVTVGEKEADEPIPASPTNKSPLGMPRKIDYIVPVVITITALPLLGVAFYVLYKRGRDYWDKRHYRRMDFLIDGMYNE